MILFLTILSILFRIATSASSDIQNVAEVKLVNGVLANSGFEYMCSVQGLWYDNIQFKHFCGCAIITDQFALTTAHCLEANKDKNLYRITAGSLQWRYGLQYQVKNIIQHEYYNPVTHDNDIGLIEVTTCFDFSCQRIKPIALPLPFENLPYYKKAIIAGWGVTSYKGTDLQETLLAAEITVLTESDIGCRSYGDTIITNNMFCAGNNGIAVSDSCQGDSGGPLVYNGRVIGLVSFGDKCNDPKMAGVYTNVSNYVAWIQNVVLRMFSNYCNNGHVQGTQLGGGNGVVNPPNIFPGNQWFWPGGDATANVGNQQVITSNGAAWTWGSSALNQPVSTNYEPWVWGAKK